MKRPATLVREITQNQARIAELRNDQVRIGAEIEGLISANKANVMALVGDAVGRLDFGQLKIEDLLSSISKLVGGAEHTDSMAEPVEGIRVVVRLSRNASAANRKALKVAGLRWNGRVPGWTGYVTSAQLDELGRLFGERVENRDQASAAQDTSTPVETAAGPLSADVEAVAALVEGQEQGRTDGGSPSTSAATITMRLPFGAFPVRRSPT
jgi:hypothetical protein